MVQKYFNSTRFLNALKYDLMLNLKSYLSFGIGLVLGLIFIDFFFILNTGSKYNLNDYLPLFFFTFVISGILVTGTSFPLLRNKKSVVHYLTLPASTFEKILIQFVFRILLFIPFFIVLFWLDFKLAAGIYNMFEWRNPAQIDDFTLLAPFESIPFNTTLDVIALISLILTLATFFFAGATYFKRFAIFKTILSLSVIIGSIFFLFAVFTRIFYPEEMKHAKTSIYLENYNIFEHLVNIQLFFYTIIIAAGLFFLPLAYFKLKEKQL